MSGYGFTSAFATELEEYLVFKGNMGFYGSSRILYLKRFDAYCVEHNSKLFDRDTVEGWVTEQLKRSGRYRSWMSYIRDFGRYLEAHGDKGAYVPEKERIVEGKVMVKGVWEKVWRVRKGRGWKDGVRWDTRMEAETEKGIAPQPRAKLWSCLA